VVHPSDRDSQYQSTRYTQQLKEARVESSVSSASDSYGNVLAEPIIGLFKSEVIHRCGPWHHLDDIEYATLDRVDCFTIASFRDQLATYRWWSSN
jgi:transposase InsO family protein